MARDSVSLICDIVVSAETKTVGGFRETEWANMGLRNQLISDSERVDIPR